MFLKDLALVARILAAKSLELRLLCEADYKSFPWSEKELFEELVEYPSLAHLDGLPAKATPTSWKE